MRQVTVLWVFTVFISLIFTTSANAGARASSEAISHFLVITDIHFDPFLACNNTKPCKEIDELRAAPADQWEQIFSKYDTQTPAYKKDSNYVLLKSALTSAQQEAKNQNVKYVFALGDFLGHNYNKNYEAYTGDTSEAGLQAFVKKTFEFLTLQFAKAFPTIDVYSAIGNNDSYEEDYASEPQHGVFYKDIGTIWASLIKDPTNKSSMLTSFQNQGYYSFDILNKKLHVIVLNSSLFSSHAIAVIPQEQSDDAKNELAWLHTELTSAAAKQQKILFLTHIPVGIDVYASLKKLPFSPVSYWKSVPGENLTAQFQNEIQPYSKNIVGILAGHVHMDWFQILTKENEKEIPVSFTPAISPLFGNNPAFKIYSFNDEALIDFTIYFAALNEDKQWKAEYSFNNKYQPSCQHCLLVDGMDKLQNTGAIADIYKTYYSVGTNSEPITKDNKWNPFYWCAIRNIDEGDYVSCIASSTLRSISPASVK